MEAERARTAAERIFLDRALADPTLGPWLRRPEPAVSLEDERTRLMRTGLRLSETMAPALHTAGREVLEALGCQATLEFFQVEATRDNACVTSSGTTVMIEISGAYLSRLDPGGLRALIGHEVGHHVAHGHRTPSGNAYVACWRQEDLALRFRMACELTADRLGLLCCRNIDDPLRLQMMSVAGLSASALNWDTSAYVEQCFQLVQNALAGRCSLKVGLHPEHCVRGYALVRFARSDLYKDLTGEGPGSATISEVDAEILRLLEMAQSASRPVAQPAPQPSTNSDRPAANEPGLLTTVRDGLKRLVGPQAAAPTPHESPSPTILDDELFRDEREQELDRRFKELEERFGSGLPRK
jgi:hypothetical protein